jgi:hypothetical protein
MVKKSEAKKVVDVFERVEVREWFSMVLKGSSVEKPSDVVVLAPYNMNDRVVVVPYREDK